MSVFRPGLLGLALVASVWTQSAGALTNSSGIAIASSTTLARMARTSAYIFSGTVLSVTHDESGAAIPGVRITFRVDQGIQGVRTGQLLTIREWAGLWQQGERYRAGEHMILFLHRPSRLGFTSPVGGAMGRYSVDRNGVLMAPARAAALLPSLKNPQPKQPIRVTGREFIRSIRAVRFAGQE